VRHCCKVQGIQLAIYLQPRLNLIKRELLFLEAAEISHVLLSPARVTNAHLLCFFLIAFRFSCVLDVLARGISARLKTGKSDYMNQKAWVWD
jgi:hypothetical protein